VPDNVAGKRAHPGVNVLVADSRRQRELAEALGTNPDNDAEESRRLLGKPGGKS